MREIKFRAWNKNLAIPGSNEFMEYSDKIGIKKFFDIYPKQGVVLNGNAERFLMQSTELKDKNGKDIYEGDIVEVSENNLRVIVWEGGAFHFKAIGWKPKSDMPTSPMYFYYLTNDIKGEIIGNIYQHPELLTSTPH